MFIRVPYRFKPYPYQRTILNNVYQGKNANVVIHRRAGKDMTCMQIWLMRALQRVGTHIYLFPLQKQAREVIWQGMDFEGRPFIEYIPKVLIEDKNEARTTIKLFNGSRMVLAGSNNFNSHMGTNPVTIINSEFSLHNPIARQYMNPILIQNGGLEINQYTPRGMNHGWDVLQQVQDDPSYYSCVLGYKKTKKCDGSPVVTEAMITRARLMGMSEETIRQEFECDFNVGNVGAFFTREMSEIVAEGRIVKNLGVDPNYPLHTVHDLGATDAHALWIFQCVGNYIHLVHYYQESHRPMKFFVDYCEKFRQAHGCRFGQHFMPHDVKNETQGWEVVESRLTAARRAGFFFQVTPKVNFADGIEQLRYVLGRCRFDKDQCSLGIRALREYCRSYDEIKGTYSAKPQEGWFLHAVDAIRYLAVNYRRLFETPHSPVGYSTSL